MPATQITAGAMHADPTKKQAVNTHSRRVEYLSQRIFIAPKLYRFVFPLESLDDPDRRFRSADMEELVHRFFLPLGSAPRARLARLVDRFETDRSCQEKLSGDINPLSVPCTPFIMSWIVARIGV